MFRYSRPIDITVAPECFTTLTVRIHKDEKLAENATTKLLEEYTPYSKQNGQTPEQLTANRFGHFTALTFPESLPERLELVAYINDLAFFHDDSTEGMDIVRANIEHEELIHAIRPDVSPTLQTQSVVKKQKLLQKFIQKFMAVDPALSLEVFLEYEKFLKAVDSSDKRFSTLDEYLPYRIDNAGYWIFMALVRFCMNTKFTFEQFSQVHDLDIAIAEVAVMGNDYYSWEKEYRAQQTKGSGGLAIRNAVAVLMEEHSCDSKSAKNLLKERILEGEAAFKTKKAMWEAANPSASDDLRRYVLSMEMMAGGNAFWSSTSPRYKS
jgi:hypothetical protein